QQQQQQQQPEEAEGAAVTSDNCKILSFVAHRSPVSAMCVVRPADGGAAELWTGARHSMRHWDVGALLRGDNRNIYSGSKANINLNSLALANGSRRIHSEVRFIVSNGNNSAYGLVFSGGSSRVQIWDAGTKASLCSLAFEGSRIVSHLSAADGVPVEFAEPDPAAPAVLSAGLTAASQLGGASAGAVRSMGRRPPRSASKPRRGFFSSLKGSSTLFMEDDEDAEAPESPRALDRSATGGYASDDRGYSFGRSGSFDAASGDEGDEEEADDFDAEGAPGADALLAGSASRDQSVSVDQQQLVSIAASPNGAVFSVYSSGLVIATAASASAHAGASTLTN
ncbi:MAG: hypothetical protein VXZ39_04620, partial [Planctomycetota bacterium]|nr:hypothetical protein [Planctomycetota bacterium]